MHRSVLYPCTYTRVVFVFVPEHIAGLSVLNNVLPHLKQYLSHLVNGTPKMSVASLIYLTNFLRSERVTE